MHKIDNLVNVKKIVTIHYQKLPRGYAAKEEWHDFWEIVFADKGTPTVCINGERIVLSRDEIIFIAPNDPHYVESGDDEPNIFIISFECRSQSMQFFRNKKLEVSKKYLPLLQNILSEAFGTFDLPDFDPSLNKLVLKNDPNLGGEQLIKNSLELLLVYLLRTESKKKTTQTFFVSKISDSDELEDEIVRYLGENVYGKLRLGQLCEKLHYSQTKLSTFFKEKTGASIYDTYLRLKADEAKTLIRKGVPFAEIAALLCFDSTSAFTNFFGKFAGLSPKEYRNSIKKEG